MHNIHLLCMNSVGILEYQSDEESSAKITPRKKKLTRIIKVTTNSGCRDTNCMCFEVQHLPKNSSFPKQSRVHPRILLMQKGLKPSNHTKAKAAMTSNILQVGATFFQQLEKMLRGKPHSQFYFL